MCSIVAMCLVPPSVDDFQVFRCIDAAGVVLVLWSAAVQPVLVGVGVEQHTVVGVAEILDDAGPPRGGADADVVADLHALEYAQER